MSRYVAMQPLVPGRRVDVLEKNEHNHTIGAWYGWWNHKTGEVALYPNLRNRYVNWPNGVKPDKKKYISDRDISVRRADGTTSWFKPRKTIAKPVPENKTEFEPVVQEKIKF